MIETADTNYEADYDTDYETPIMSRYFERKCFNNPKNNYLTLKIFDDLSHRPQIMAFFSYLRITFSFSMTS